MSGHQIIHKLNIKAAAQEVFNGVSSPEGLDRWWTKGCTGRPEMGSLYELDFGSVQWQAQVSHVVEPHEFELTMTRCDQEWQDSLVNFEITDNGDSCTLKFSHSGWPQANDHFITSNYCWAMYLRILKRYLEFGEEVPYEERLIV